MRNKLASILWLAGVLAACHAPVHAAETIPVERDIVYSTVGNEKLMLDLARPATGDGPFPLVLCFHGGGWSAGNRSDVRWLLPQLVQQGFVAATVSYRLAPKHPYPAQIHDAKAAVRFLRAHAEKYGIDPSRVGAIGFSAGGQLAMLLGMTEPSDGQEGYTADSPHPSKVQAVVNIVGSGDLRSTLRRKLSPEAEKIVQDYYKTDSDSLFKGVFGTLDTTAPIFTQASPIVYADPKDAPVISFHGTRDEFIDYERVLKFDAAMKQAGASHELVTLEGEPHNFTRPAMARVMPKVFEFLNQHLGRASKVK